MKRTLTKPELCQVCATGHDRVHCIYAPVPCEDRIGLWDAGEAEGRKRAASAVENMRRTLTVDGPATTARHVKRILDDTLAYTAKLIREGGA